MLSKVSIPEILSYKLQVKVFGFSSGLRYYHFKVCVGCLVYISLSNPDPDVRLTTFFELHFLFEERKGKNRNKHRHIAARASTRLYLNWARTLYFFGMTDKPLKLLANGSRSWLQVYWTHFDFIHNNLLIGISFNTLSKRRGLGSYLLHELLTCS